MKYQCKMCGEEFEIDEGLVKIIEPEDLLCLDCIKSNTKIRTITMADLGNHIVCPFCKAKDKELKIYEKALEMACERLQREDVYRTQAQVKYYLEQAKKEIEDE